MSSQLPSRLRLRWLPLLLLVPMVPGRLGASGVDGERATVAPAGSASSVAGQPKQHGKREIQGDARIVHALDRLTFGPRPGDVAAVKTMGLKAWIDLQLTPAKIDDSALEEKLKSYPAMQMPVSDLIRELPPPPLIRQVADGNFMMPADATLAKVYATQVFLEQRRRQEQAAKRADQQPAQATMQETQTSAPPAMGDSSKEQDRRILAELHVGQIVALPPQERMAKVLSMPTETRAAVAEGLSPEERVAFVQGLTPQQAQLFASLSSPERTVAAQLQATKMLRVIDSNRQLQEVMTDFWFNHFNVDIHKGPLMAYYLGEYEDKVIRPNALGNFEALLDATAQSRAMMLYLDNASSVGPDSPAAVANAERAANGMGGAKKKNQQLGLNENYGRELMELHTLGVDGGYTQNDVIAVAKVFTGWTIEKPLRGGGFVFDARRHEPGAKVVLGHTIQESGEQEGLEVLHLLATSPATAHHISEELAERFVSDHPPQALVDRMSRTFLKTHGDIREVLRTMFSSPEFWSQSTVDAKVKTPLELVASAARASGAQVNHPGVLALAVNRLGMPLYGCQPPTGYSANADAWISAGALVERMSFAIAFADHRVPGTVTNWDDLLGPDEARMNTAEKESRLEQVLLHGDASTQTRDAVTRQLASGQLPAFANSFSLGGNAGRGYIVPVSLPLSPTPTSYTVDPEAAMIAGLLLGSPEFQSH